MKEKTGKIFSIAGDNQPVAGCTISKEVYASGQDYISYFSLAKDTDISAEIYSYHKLLILHEGDMEVYTDKEIFTLESGDCILTPTNIPVGMRTNTKAIYTEISIRRNTMNNAIKAGEVFKLAEEINGVALSMPAIVGKHGVEGQVPIELNDKEKAALKESADTLKSVIGDVLKE